jgi:hypothetical protein
MAQVCKQIEVEVADKVGKLAEVTDKLKGAGVNILALLAWVEGGRGKLMMVTSDNDKACQAVTGIVEKCQMGEVVCLTTPNTPGALDPIARKLADAGINIQCIYATAGQAQQATIVLATTDNAKAAQIV